MKRFSTFGAATLSAAALLLGTIGAQAAGPPTPFKCNAAKVKCASGKATGLLGCHNKAEGKDVPIDPLCVSKVVGKFTTPAKGCMEKAEKDLVKSPCTHVGDTDTIEGKVDAFVLDVVTELDPTYPTAVLSKCSAGKKKCVSTLAGGLLSCINKAIGKNLSVDPACTQKANDKFTGGAVPSKGCFAKLEAKVGNDCLTTGDSAALQAKAAAFAADIASSEANPSSSCPAILDFTTAVGGGTCGTAQDASSTVLKTLHCGGLNLGGGASTVGEGPTPDGTTNRFLLAGAGSCTIGATSAAPAVNSTDPDCTTTGCNFGAPLEIPNPTLKNLTTCVLNTFAAPVSGTLDMSTGASSTNTMLTSTTYLTGNVNQPCPRCRSGGAPVSGSPSSPKTGTCDRGPRTGMACTSTNSIGLTRDCLTGGSSAANNCPNGTGTSPCSCQAGVSGMDSCLDGTIVGPIAVDLSPLTTGTSSKTDASGKFCPGQGGTPGTAGCFNAPTCVTISETGSPGGPITPNVSAPATLASVFCVASTLNGLVNFAADLPGPGATSLVGTYNAHN